MLATICVAAGPRAGRAQVSDLRSDTWVAVDGLGRRVQGNAECGPVRTDRQVGIFYHLWHFAGQAGPFNISQILAADPEAINEPDNPAWGPVLAMHHWNQSIFGYYISTDSYVFRKHAQMLVDAGVDAVIFDYSNGFMSTHRDLCAAWAAVRASGNATPQIVFLCPFSPDSSPAVVSQIYQDLYAPGLYQDLWYSLGGKPLIMANPQNQLSPEKDFFTFRTPVPSYFTGPTGPNQWGWLEDYPQHVFLNDSGESEEVTVGVAQNCAGGLLGPFTNPGSQGRSFHNEHMVTVPGAVDQGLNFAEQWRRGLDLGPKFIFVTGWNEWAAQRLVDGQHNVFWDQFTQDYSRDVEPMQGGHGDNYYYQMASYIRQYKGARAVDSPSAPKTISINGSFSDWSDVGPEYRDTVGDTYHRNWAGYGSAGTYINTSGRNDIVLAKVARDSNNVYFYVKANASLTSYTNPNWMLLFIDSDQRPSTGWNGYDYVVNYPASSSTVTTVKRNTGGWNWTSVGTASYRRSGSEMEIAVPRSLIGQTGADVSFDFHWADNIQKTDDIMEFTVSGDSAPNGRFNYRYTTDTTPPPPVANLQVVRTGSNTLGLSWTNPASSDFAGTIVRYRTDTYPTSPSDGTWICDQYGAGGAEDGCDYEGSDIQPDRAYHLAAFAYDGVSNYSVTAAQVRAGSMPPTPVVAFSVTPGNTSNTLQWTNPDHPCFRGTMVRVSTEGYPGDPASGTLVIDQPGSPRSTGTYLQTGLTNAVKYYYSAFAHDDYGQFAAGVHAAGTPSVPADFDHDGDVDMEDFGRFQACLSGHLVPQNDPACAWAKLTGHNYVDQADLTRFLRCLGGVGILPDPTCAN